MATACFIVAAVLFLLLGIDVSPIGDDRNDDLFEFSSALVAAGLAFMANGYNTFFRKD